MSDSFGVLFPVEMWTRDNNFSGDQAISNSCTLLLPPFVELHGFSLLNTSSGQSAGMNGLSIPRRSKSSQGWQRATMTISQRLRFFRDSNLNFPALIPSGRTRFGVCLNFYRPVEVSGLLILDDDDDEADGEGSGKVLGEGSGCAAALAAGDVEKSSDSAFSRYASLTHLMLECSPFYGENLQQPCVQ